jgi:hypothetical protein
MNQQGLLAEDEGHRNCEISRCYNLRSRDTYMFRVIDEDKSEPDGYLYPASMFASIELPEVAERALMSVGV